jgi:hypothetical protein
VKYPRRQTTAADDLSVMPGLVPGIHVFTCAQRRKTWMAGTSPAMTPSQTKRLEK